VRAAELVEPAGPMGWVLYFGLEAHLEVIQRVRVACPRCQAPVTGDFKFCPTCAYRLKPGAPVDSFAEPRPRSVASMLLMVGAALFVGLIAGVGIWLFRDQEETPHTPTSGGSGAILPPEQLRADNVRKYMRHVAQGTAYWGQAPEDDRTRPLQAEALEVLIYEVPCAFYAEFLTDQAERLADDNAVPGPSLQRIWKPTTPDERKFAHQYLQHWVETYLKRTGTTPTETTPAPAPLLRFVPVEQRQQAATSIEALAQAVPFPWPHKLGLLLLAPPSWAYENIWEELSWRLPLYSDPLPVTDVSWSDAVAFGEWLTAGQGGDVVFRLPLAGEWMRVAHGNHPPRGPGAWDYPWGNSLLTHACNNAELYPPGIKPILHPVSQRYIDTDPEGTNHDGRTVDGIFGMAGNAGEWVLNQATTLRRIGEALSVYHDPEDERENVLGWSFGGSFRSTLLDCTVESQEDHRKYERSDEVGFRIVAVPRGP
jgi:formylglycine-generating enzyme required for sulfatase activity